MKLTLLPDMEAKKQNRQKRKRLRRERKLARNDRRRRKILSKRDRFWKLFITRWVVLIVVSSILCAAGTVMEERQKYLQVKKVYENWKNGIYHDAVLATYELDSYGDMYTDEEKQAMFANRVRANMLYINYSNMYDFSATMYEWGADTVDKVCDSQEGIVLAVKTFNDVSSSQTMFYQCPIEVFGDIDIIKYDGEEFENGYPGIGWGMEDCYIKGTEFRPGVVKMAHVSEDGLVTKRESYDLTPEDTEGWLHIDSEEEREKSFAAAEGEEGGYPHSYLIPYVGGTKENSPAYKETNTIDYEVYDDGSMAITFFAHDGEIARSDLENNMSENELYGESRISSNIKWESMGKRYFILTYGYYDFYKYHMNDCIRVYCIVAVLVTVLALLMARSRWIWVRTQYEIEDYRKSLTDAMAHDLKSPLMALSGFAENLKDNVHTEKREYYADVISENVNYMNGIIEHILELSKTEANDIKLKRERMELQTLFDEVVSKYEEQIDKKKLMVDTEGDITINADRQLMLQAIDNLIFNAVKYSNNESIINIICDKNCMTISNTYSAGKDEPDEMDLLKPFVKGDESRSNKSGSGIGLTIAKNILELHGYKLSLRKEENEFIVKVCF